MHGKLKNYLIQNHIFIICQTKKQQQNILICSSSVCSKKNKSYRISPVHLECYLCDKGIFLNQLLSKRGGGANFHEIVGGQNHTLNHPGKSRRVA